MGAHGDQQMAVLAEGIFSLLDTDLYKLTMQSAVHKYFPDVEVSYNLTNRTPHMRLNRKAYNWLRAQIEKLGNIAVSPEEIEFLRSTCTYLSGSYLEYMSKFRLRPSEQIRLAFHTESDTGDDEELGDIELHTQGLWVETILYEIPLLALTSEAYFKFCDRDWDYDGQVERAQQKGEQLLEEGCLFSEFGSRRRRDYHTQDLVLEGLKQAQDLCKQKGWKGKLTGTSNVHFAMKHSLAPVGTVAHEWFMGAAAVTNDYEHANETALRYWVGTFGEGVLGIALTDTFGTPNFLDSFRKPVPRYTSAVPGASTTMPSAAASTTMPSVESLSKTKAPIHAEREGGEDVESELPRTYAQVFTGVRQDSGDPVGFVKTMREFYDKEGIKDKKTIVFSDSLNVERCLEYKKAAEEAGFQPSFGVGTFLTNDFQRKSDGKKSVPLNIVVKLSHVGGRPAVKISDNIGKNTGDPEVVAEVKRRLGYSEKQWSEGDESMRWGAEGDRTPQPTSVTA